MSDWRIEQNTVTQKWRVTSRRFMQSRGPFRTEARARRELARQERIDAEQDGWRPRLAKVLRLVPDDRR
jgi:hypothetical protein